ncbi:MAG: kelch repeat-containing protein, partial [Gallionella sp.]
MRTTTYTKACTMVVVLMLTACGGGGGSSNTVGAGVTSATALVDWTWVSGSDTGNPAGSFLSAPFYPGAMEGMMSWTDGSGQLWMFGGGGCDTNGCGGGSNYVDFNDLWRFDGSNWNLIKGSGASNPPGIYGTLGTAALANTPGSRQYAATWTVGSTLWMFGGRGRDSAGTFGDLSDLWSFDGTNWTWVAGGDTVGTVENYTNTSAHPGDRRGAVSWIDVNGDLWLFGGKRDSSLVSTGYLSDLWKYNIASDTWTFVAGTNTLDHSGNYGTIGNPG